MRVADFDFDLPKELIAQAPPDERGRSRLLVVDRAAERVTQQAIGDLPAWLRPGDLLVVNDTKVFPARLLGHRTPSGGAVECMLLERVAADRWDALVHPGQKLKTGSRFICANAERSARQVHGEIVGRGSFGRRTVRLWTEDGSDLEASIDAIGHMPLPPYIARPDSATDLDRYQTVYARARGSIAAPTAGLHFTPALLATLDAHGVERAAVTLHVGYGTFKPVRAELVEEHVVDPEHYEIDEATAAQLTRARAEGRRIVAVGTTTVRALESAARAAEAARGAGAASATGPSATGPSGTGDAADALGAVTMGTVAIRAGRGVTDLFIHEGHRFRMVDALLTNFHLPKSSLLMLVCAFAGRERTLAAYREAVGAGYRFYSYGDAMLVV